MSARPISHKKAARLSKVLSRKPLPRFFDLVQWMLDNGHARTKREARETILAGRVRSDSHQVGIGNKMPVVVAGKVVVKDTVNPRVAIDLRDNLMVLPA